MGFFSSLLKALGRERINDGFDRHRLPKNWWKIDGFFPLATGGQIEIVGESHFQETFETVIGDRWRGGVYWHVVAQLFLIDDNAADPNAVGIMIEGMPAGYIPRDQAQEIRTAVLQANPERLPVICKGEIIGGFVRGSKRGAYGLVLDVSQPLRRKTR
ncbi:hypothetical protein [Sphingomonas sp.]|uniref:hypothetical protein n=1 Tax=Sphingomonas sp. TaxID=28214 RepID=UPI00262697EB|nr:hypothetical protein [Sphingomonas sp.]